MRSIVRWTLGAGALLTALAGTTLAQGDSPYMRVVEEDAQTVRLDIAVRTLAPTDGDGPLINLVGAIHIGDASFYEAAQAILDVHDLVLYEGVGGAREPGPEPRGDKAAAAVTDRRVRFLSVLAEDARRRDGAFPASSEELAASAGEPLRGLVGDALVDGWGRPFKIEADGGFDIVSLGADGREGGAGADADVRASEVLATERVVSTSEESAGLQRDLADALGLMFQLDGIDYSGAHWRNSDLSVGEIQKALGGGEPRPGDREREPGEPIDPDAPESLKAADYLFRTLSGESFLAKASGFLLRMLGSSASGRVMVKLMLADMLTHADDLLAMQPGALADLMKVIVEDRNSAVIRDLGAVIEDEPETGTVAVFYGAGHFGDLEQRIEDELGYEYAATLWVPAMTIDLEEAGLNVTSVRPMRKMMGDMIEAQMKAMEPGKR